MSIPQLKRRKKKKLPRPVGRPKLMDTRIEDLTEDQLMFASLIAKGMAPVEVSGIVGCSDYVRRRWLKMPAMQEKINELTDETQAVEALNFLERKLQKFGGSA